MMKSSTSDKHFALLGLCKKNCGNERLRFYATAGHNDNNECFNISQICVHTKNSKGAD